MIKNYFEEINFTKNSSNYGTLLKITKTISSVTALYEKKYYW